MKLIKKIQIGISCLRVIALRHSIPLFVSWDITNRCNQRCIYCGVPGKKSYETDTETAKKIMRSLYRAGTRVMKLTGGEPLVRKDIIELIIYGKNLGLIMNISTNGKLLEEKKEVLSVLDNINISFDGPRAVHDSIRGQGSYNSVIRGAELAKRHKTDFSFYVTLTKLNCNLQIIDELISDVQKFDTYALFQPATERLLFSEKQNDLAPNEKEYGRAVKHLIGLKEKKTKAVGNSMAGLRHLLHWPHPTKINCVAGRLAYRLDSKTNLYACARYFKQGRPYTISTPNTNKHFDQIKPPFCDQCWCSSMVELNLLCDMRINALFNAFKI